MQARIQKWGNSLALRIPRPFATQAGIDNDSLVDVSIVENRLVITPLGPSYSLAELLRDVTEDNIHDEVDAGAPVGNEAW
jgi:antitoxin MazE